MEQSVEAMTAIPARMVEAWNRGDATGFFADFARIVSPGAGVIHNRVGILMPGEGQPPTRFSMQLFVVTWQDGHWVVAVLQNARLPSLEAPAALDSLPAG